MHFLLATSRPRCLQVSPSRWCPCSSSNPSNTPASLTCAVASTWTQLSPTSVGSVDSPLWPLLKVTSLETQSRRDLVTLTLLTCILFFVAFSTAWCRLTLAHKLQESWDRFSSFTVVACHGPDSVCHPAGCNQHPPNSWMSECFSLPCLHSQWICSFPPCFFFF